MACYKWTGELPLDLMPRGRRKTRTGDETRSTFDKSRDLDIAIARLQTRYLESDRHKPTMRELLMRGINLVLKEEGLTLMPELERQPKDNVVPIATKSRQSPTESGQVASS